MTDSDKEVDIVPGKETEEEREEEKSYSPDSNDENEENDDNEKEEEEEEEEEENTDEEEEEEEEDDDDDDDDDDENEDDDEDDDEGMNYKDTLIKFVDEYKNYKTVMVNKLNEKYAIIKELEDDVAVLEKDNAVLKDKVAVLEEDNAVLQENVTDLSELADKLKQENDKTIKRSKEFKSQVVEQINELITVNESFQIKLDETQKAYADAARRLAEVERTSKCGYTQMKDCEIRLKVNFQENAISEITLIPENDDSRAEIVEENSILKERVVRLKQELAVAQEDIENGKKSLAEAAEANAKLEKKYKHASKKVKTLQRSTSPTKGMEESESPRIGSKDDNLSSSTTSSSPEGDVYRRVLKIYSTYIMRNGQYEIDIPYTMRLSIFDDIVKKSPPNTDVFDGARKYIIDSMQKGAFAKWVSGDSWKEVVSPDSPPIEVMEMLRNPQLLADFKRVVADSDPRITCALIFLVDILDLGDSAESITKAVDSSSLVSSGTHLRKVSQTSLRMSRMSDFAQLANSSLSMTSSPIVSTSLSTPSSSSTSNTLSPMPRKMVAVTNLKSKKSIMIANNINNLMNGFDNFVDESERQLLSQASQHGPLFSARMPSILKCPPASTASTVSPQQPPPIVVIPTNVSMPTSTLSGSKIQYKHHLKGSFNMKQQQLKDNGVNQVYCSYAEGIISAMASVPNTKEVWAAVETTTDGKKSKIVKYRADNPMQNQAAKMEIDAHVNHILSVDKEVWVSCSDSKIRVYKSHKTAVEPVILSVDDGLKRSPSLLSSKSSSRLSKTMSKSSKGSITCSVIVENNVWSITDNLEIILWKIKDKKLNKTIKTHSVLWAIISAGGAVWVGTDSGINFYSTAGKLLGKSAKMSASELSSSSSSSSSPSDNGDVAKCMDTQVDRLVVVKDKVWAFHNSLGLVSVWDMVKRVPESVFAMKDVSAAICVGDYVWTCSDGENLIHCWDANTHEEYKSIGGMLNDPITTLALARRPRKSSGGENNTSTSNSSISSSTSSSKRKKEGEKDEVEEEELCVWGAAKDKSVFVWSTPFMAHDLAHAGMSGPCVICGKRGGGISTGYHCQLCDEFNVHKSCYNKSLLDSYACGRRKSSDK